MKGGKVQIFIVAMAKEKKEQIANSWLCFSYQMTSNNILLPKMKADQQTIPPVTIIWRRNNKMKRFKTPFFTKPYFTLSNNNKA